jgi:hypothetical protein
MAAVGLPPGRRFRRRACNRANSANWPAPSPTQPGPSDAIVYPGDGPFDKRLGYSALGEFLPRLLKRDYLINEQVRSPRR